MSYILNHHSLIEGSRHSDFYSPSANLYQTENAGVKLPKVKVCLIHGTGAGTWVFEKYKRELIRIIVENFSDPKQNNEIHLQKWDGGNNSQSRKNAIDALVAEIKSQHVPGETLILVGHSHGGNIALEAANQLSRELADIPITIVTLNTPVREDYNPAYGSNVAHFNYYTSNDKIQLQGGFSQTGQIENIRSGRSSPIRGMPPRGYLTRNSVLKVAGLFMSDDELKTFLNNHPSLKNLGGESGKAGNQFNEATNVEVPSPEPDFYVRSKHRLWNKKHLPELEKSIQESLNSKKELATKK